jgi:serine/threonine-protein kinase HipA
MRSALVLVNGIPSGILQELENGKYDFTYHADYQGAPVSLTMPLSTRMYTFDKFPAFFDGLLPEGVLLEALLRKYKLDRNDYFGQLLQVGQDLVGSVTVENIK